MSMSKKDKCEICGLDLFYSTNQNEYKNILCNLCRNEFNTNIYCPNGHYICNECHSKEPQKIIEDFCELTSLKNPFKMVEIVMNHPKFKMYGPEHHILTSAILLTFLKNNGIKKPNGKEITYDDIKEAINRSSKIPGGWCGFYGSCGAAMGSGVAISVFTEATPSKAIPRSLANEITSCSLAKIADNFEHCCKRSVKISIYEAINFLKEKFEIDLPFKHKKCSFSSKNDKCIKDKCPFF